MATKKFTDAQGEEALLKNYGNVSAAARALGVSQPTLWERIERSERLQAARKEAEEQTLDMAEAALVEAVRSGAAWAVCFLLKTKGRRRGFVTRQEGSMTLANGENPFALKIDWTCCPGSAALPYDPDDPDSYDRWKYGGSAPEPEPPVKEPERPAVERPAASAAPAPRPEQRARRDAVVEDAIKRNWWTSGRGGVFEV